jgi:hypothetical protein
MSAADLPDVRQTDVDLLAGDGREYRRPSVEER